MKLQALSIVFALIIIPIMLVLTYFIQLQVNTITLQKEYDTKLLDATYDAMSSFEINTANEDMSSVSDSLRTIIEASNNVFFNTLSTNLGMSNASKSFLEPHIPAIVYTLYDGYYIYGPTKSPEVLSNDGSKPDEHSQGQALTVGGDGVKTADGGKTYKYDITVEGGSAIGEPDLDSEHKLDYSQILFTKKEGTADGIPAIDPSDSKKIYTANHKEAYYKTKNIMKSYMPYSARYQTDDMSMDIEITYTLDNYVTIEGRVADVYYSKSGYLIKYMDKDDNSILNVYLGDEDPNNEVLKSEISERNAQIHIENGQRVIVEIDNGSSNKEKIIDISSLNKETLTNDLIFYTNQIENAQLLKSGYDTDVTDLQNIIDAVRGKKSDFLPTVVVSSENFTLVKEQVISELNKEISNIQYDLDRISAAVYYAKAKIFTKWINDTFGTNDVGEYKLQEKNIKQDFPRITKSSVSVDNKDIDIFDFSNSTRGVFDLNGGNSSSGKGKTEISIDSPFYTHKLNVIRNSIQYNLDLAMIAYTTNTTFNYAMPIISDSEWDKMVSNPSIVAFMQGFECGFKTYNNYVVVSSYNNEVFVNSNDLYFVNKDNFNDESTEYHKIDCTKLHEQNKDLASKDLLAFASKEIKYDKVYNKTKSTTYYWYDHKNLACYECINDGNYHKIDVFNSADEYQYLRKSFYIAVGKERNNLYKPNAMSRQEGYEVIYDDNKPDTLTNKSKNGLNKIDYVEIVFGPIYSSADLKTVKLTSDIGVFDAEKDSLNTNKTTTQTKILNINNTNNSSSEQVSKDFLYKNIKLNDAYLYDARNGTGTKLSDKIEGYRAESNSGIIKYIRVVYK